MKNAVPTNLSPDLIGEPVALQVWDRKRSGEKEIEQETFMKIVGTLEGYIQTPQGFTITFAGMHNIAGVTKVVKYESEYHEFYVYKELNEKA